MNVNGIGQTNYPAWYGAEKARRQQAAPKFADQTGYAGQAAGTQRAQPQLVLHGKNDADEGETVVGSSVNAQTGVGIAVYKPQDFDAANPVYHVKTWDADGSMTERMVNIAEVDPQNCDEVEMSAYMWYLSNSGKCPNAFMSFAGARAQHQTSQRNYTAESAFEKSNWVEIFRDFMQMQYAAGNRKGYLDYKKLLEFME